MFELPIGTTTVDRNHDGFGNLGRPITGELGIQMMLG